MTTSAGPAGAHPHAFLWGTAVALTLHGLVAAALVLVPTRVWHGERETTVEIDLARPAPPPEPLPPPPDPPPPPREMQPVARRHATRLPPPSPPMPNQQSKPAASDESAKPVFGVTPDSVVAGDSPVAVPVGNTLMTKDRTLAQVPLAILPPAPSPPPAFAPIDEEYVTEWPREPSKPKPEYPEQARRMGVGGRVTLKLGIDRKGNVHSVRVLQKAGFGMDEAAVKAIWAHHFTPAKGRQGEPVDIVLRYDIVFDPQGN